MGMNSWSIVVQFGRDNTPVVTQAPFAGGPRAPLQETGKTEQPKTEGEPKPKKR
jgi:hypothetical protein